MKHVICFTIFVKSDNHEDLKPSPLPALSPTQFDMSTAGLDTEEEVCSIAVASYGRVEVEVPSWDLISRGGFVAKASAPASVHLARISALAVFLSCQTPFQKVYLFTTI